MNTPRERFFVTLLPVLVVLLVSACRVPALAISTPGGESPTYGGSQEMTGPAGSGEREDPVGVAETDSIRLQPEDFTYQGAFRLPSEFDWGARGLAYYPAGDGGAGSLLVTGLDTRPAEFAEVGIPAPVRASDWQTLPTAAMLRPMTNFDGDLIENQVDATTTCVSGIEYVPRRGSQTGDKLYGAADWWYSVADETFPTIWFAEPDGSNPRGLFHVGQRSAPYHGNKAGDYLFAVPQWYADQYLGGRTLVTGKTRGAFEGSQGPTLFAFRPWEDENPSGDLDAIPLLWYRIIYPDCAGPNVGDKSVCDYPDFTMCDKWEGASFVESGQKRAILLLGLKGLGANDYGPPAGPDSCNPYQGYHCDPMERQVIFYDVDELGQVAQGQRDAWTVDPYATWRPEEFFSRDSQGHTCGEVGGVAADSAGRRLFMVEKGLGENNSAVIHVWLAGG